MKAEVTLKFEVEVLHGTETPTVDDLIGHFGYFPIRESEDFWGCPETGHTGNRRRRWVVFPETTYPAFADVDVEITDPGPAAPDSSGSRT